MCKLNKKSGLWRIDPCMKKEIEELQKEGIVTLSCCCGHKKYSATIVCKNESGIIFERNSGIEIPRKKKFYKKDKQGYYYIPEVVEDEDEQVEMCQDHAGARNISTRIG